MYKGYKLKLALEYSVSMVLNCDEVLDKLDSMEGRAKQDQIKQIRYKAPKLVSLNEVKRYLQKLIEMDMVKLTKTDDGTWTYVVNYDKDGE